MNHDLKAIFTGQLSFYNDIDGHHWIVRNSELILLQKVRALEERLNSIFSDVQFSMELEKDK